MKIIKNCIFSLLCLILVIIIMIVKAPSVDSSYLIVYGVSVISILDAVFKGPIIKLNKLTCNDYFAEFSANLGIIISGLLSVVLALTLWK
jgi:hypothetical protein